MSESTSLYNFVDVEAKLAQPSTIRDLVRNVLRHNNGACYAEIEPLLMPPGKTGSRSFDQHMAVIILLRFDAEYEQHIKGFQDSKPSMNHRALWEVLQSVLRNSGFKMQHGRLTGLLDHKPNDKSENNETGQPDID